MNDFFDLVALNRSAQNRFLYSLVDVVEASIKANRPHKDGVEKLHAHSNFLFCNPVNRFTELSRSSTGFIILELGVEAGQIKLKSEG